SVSLYGCSSTCEWPSTNPGRSVSPGRLTTWAPAASMMFAGPTASIRSPFTRTDQFSCMAAPSKTRAGLKMMVLCAQAKGVRTARRGSTSFDRSRIGAIIGQWDYDRKVNRRSLLLSGLAAAAGAAQTQAAKRRNIVFILTDDHRYDAFGFLKP